MTREEVSQYITATHIYAGVTPMEAVNCPVNKQLTEINGVTYLGTEIHVPALLGKELLPS